MSGGSFRRKQNPPYPLASSAPPICRLVRRGLIVISKSIIRYVPEERNTVIFVFSRAIASCRPPAGLYSHVNHASMVTLVPFCFVRRLIGCHDICSDIHPSAIFSPFSLIWCHAQKMPR